MWRALEPKTVCDEHTDFLGALRPPLHLNDEQDKVVRANPRATNPRTGGRPTRDLAGDQPETWRATDPRTGGRPTRELAGDRPENWRATNPRIGRPLDL